jgi:hypothetical protein
LKQSAQYKLSGMFLRPSSGYSSSRPDGTTLVTISNWGFRGSNDEMFKQAINSMGGFSFLLAGVKALPEHNVAINLSADHDPDVHRTKGAVSNAVEGYCLSYEESSNKTEMS